MSSSTTIKCAGCGKTEELITVHFDSDWLSHPNGWLVRLGAEAIAACSTTCASRADEIARKVPKVISLDQLGEMKVGEAYDALKGVKDFVADAIKSRSKKK